MRRVAAVILAWTLSVSSGTAYYHFIHYRPSPLAPVPEKFDLTALPNKTVTFFASDAGPNQFPVNDSFPSVLSQIQQATQIWNSVESSDLRVAFGGLFSLSTPKTAPGGEVVFEEL